MFGNKSAPSRIYSYGALEPNLGFTLLTEQIFLSHRYRNDMVALERKRREAVAASTRTHFPRLVELDALLLQIETEIEEVRQRIAADNIRERRRRATPEQQGEVRQLKERRTALYAEQKLIKADAYGPEDVLALRTQIRNVERSAGPNTPTLTAQVAQLEGQMVDTVAAWYGRVPGAQLLRQEIDMIEDQHNADSKALRARSGLYWGNYLAVEQAASTFRQGAPPEFKRFNGEGRVAVQIQGGITPEQLLACTDARIKLELLPAGAINRPWKRRTPPVSMQALPHHNKRRRRANLWVRVGSTDREVLIDNTWHKVERATQVKSRTGARLRYELADGRTGLAEPGNWRGEADAPIWAVLPMIYHRDLPAGSQIKWLYVHREKVATRWRWKVSMVISAPDGFAGRSDLATTGTVAVNAGWRQLSNGDVRVCYWHGDDGQHGDVVIPADRVAALWDRAEQLRSTRDLLFNEAVAKLTAWMEENRAILPAWLVERTEYLSQWRSSARLSGLVLYWRNNRFVGDESMYPWLDGWLVINPNPKRPNADGRPKAHYIGFRKQDKHLYDWEQGLRDRGQNWRRNLFRHVALGLAQKYRRVLVGKMNLRELQERPTQESNDVEIRSAKRNARIASPGLLLQFIKERMEVTEMESTNLTQRCPECRRLDAFDASKELVRQCRHCGIEQDQDRRHCRNLMWQDREPAATVE